MMQQSPPSQKFTAPKSLLRYFRAELYKSISFVMVAFVGLFLFFDLIAEIDRLSQPGTSWLYYVASICLGLPARVYEIAPIAALIGSIYALVQIAANSEFTAMRAAGLGTRNMLMLIGRIALSVMAVTVFFGEAVAPLAERAAVPLYAKALGNELNRDFRSGYWLRDSVQPADGQTGVRFVNFANFDKEGSLSGLQYFELDNLSRIRAWVRAESAQYDSQTKSWLLNKVLIQTYFDESAVEGQSEGVSGFTARVSDLQQLDNMTWQSNLSPDFLTGLFVRPDRMSAWQLYNYGSFLKANKQATGNIDLALAKKLVYPFAILIMMMISLPFAYLHFRSGAVSVRVFAGIMIGVGFHLANNLFSHLSMVASLPPLLSAALPTVIGFVVGMGALWYVGHPAPARQFSKWLGREGSAWRGH